MKKFIILLLLPFISACRPEPELADLVRYMVVQTQYDQASINESQNIFHTYSSFTMRLDTLGFVSTRYSNTYIVDGAGDDFVRPVSRLVRNSLIHSGFTLVNANENPDFGVNVIVLDNFNFFQTVNYPMFYPGGYFGYYGFFFPIVSTYFSVYGTLVIEVVDIKNYSANGNRYKVIWRAYIGDLYATLDLKNNTLEAIGQAFQQSPYIQRP